MKKQEYNKIIKKIDRKKIIDMYIDYHLETDLLDIAYLSDTKLKKQLWDTRKKLSDIEKINFDNSIRNL